MTALYAECLNAECRNAECRYAECRGAKYFFTNKIYSYFRLGPYISWGHFSFSYIQQNVNHK